MAVVREKGMLDLDPCPFCGGEAEIERTGTARQSTIYACQNCGCRLETGETFNHGAQWNQRAVTVVDRSIEFGRQSDKEPGMEWISANDAPSGSSHPYSEQGDAATFLLVWNGFHIGVAYRDSDPDMPEMEWISEDGEFVSPPPTHAMRLPSPPKLKTTTKGAE
jgi:Lar family restriction alleviation protein